jgi:hypothetical protein
METFDLDMSMDNETDDDGNSLVHRHRLLLHRAFHGNSPVHCRRLRPSGGPLVNDLSEDLVYENQSSRDALLNRATMEIILPIPFTSRSCKSCLNQRKGDFILLNLNAALQHARSHHCGVRVRYSCNSCGKTYKGKHSAQCHVPKCKGPPTEEDKTVICGLCNQAFKTQRGLSQHECLIHPVERNEKRERAAKNRQSRGPNKECGKVWVKEELDTMIRLEKSLEGHPHIAMQMKEHLPEKSLKQIRDKLREPTFKVLVVQYKATHGNSATPELNDTICLSSDSETEPRPVPAGCHISETEDEDTSYQGQNSRQLRLSSPRTGQTSLAHRQRTELGDLPGLEWPAGDGPPPSPKDANDCEPQVSTPPLEENGAIADVGSTTMTEEEWQTGIVSQTLNETPENSTLSSKCRDLHSRLVSILTDISDKWLPATKSLLDEVYAQILDQVGLTQVKQAYKRTRSKGSKT